MIRHRITVLMLAAACFAAGAYFAAGARAQGPDKADKIPARPIGEIIAELAVARDFETASSLYAEGQRADRKSVLLHQAFMKRALLDGRPSVAFHAAGDLTRLTPDDPSAWSVLAYMHARRGKMLWAFTSAMQAIDLTDKDPSVLHNTGNLVAWYDHHTPPPKLGPQVVSQIKAGQPKWETYERYLAPYKTAVKAFADHRAQTAEIEKTIDLTNKKYDDIRTRRADLDAAFRRATTTIREYEKRVARLRRMIQDRKEDDRDRNKGSGRRHSRSNIKNLEDDVDECRDKIGTLKKTNASRRSENGKLARQQVETSGTVNRLRYELRVHRMTPPELTWVPPTVDGKPIEDRELQAATQPAEKPKPVTSQPWAPPSNEARLKMAHMFLRNNRPWKALELLEAVIQDDPNSESATEAQKMIEKHTLKTVTPGPGRKPK